jgi:hypothetical protein
MFWVMICCAVVGGSLAGCGHHGHDGHSESEAASEEAVAAVEVTPEMQAVLVRADLADGTEDHIVAKCPGCGLAMEGSADHASNVGEYALHFCSDGCQERFEEDVAESLLALAEPEESDGEAMP